jgi:hypothetical protein
VYLGSRAVSHDASGKIARDTKKSPGERKVSRGEKIASATLFIERARRSGKDRARDRPVLREIYDFSTATRRLRADVRMWHCVHAETGAARDPIWLQGGRRESPTGTREEGRVFPCTERLDGGWFREIGRVGAGVGFFD